MARNRWIALVPLAEAAVPEAAALLGELAKLETGIAPPNVTSESAGGFTLAWDRPQQENEPLVLDEATANVTLIREPIPWEKLEGPCATAWYWPEAAQVLRGHESHLFVTLLDESPKAINQAERLMRLLVAVASSMPAIGIVWGASGAVHEPAAFAQLAATASSDNLPLNLWIDFRAYEQDTPGHFGLFTTGLQSLGHREFEVAKYAGDPQLLIGGVYNIAHYLLEKSPTLRASEVIGLPDGSEVTLEEGNSLLDPTQEVWRLSFNGPSAG